MGGKLSKRKVVDGLL
uniref:Truncated nef protein n=1 Tax=Human immunodeficiency virus type 1 TaxID=11676 RepID=H9TPZ0_HV1|nr:truncated nef protein [Human immunodeficiency virus 1]